MSKIKLFTKRMQFSDTHFLKSEIWSASLSPSLSVVVARHPSPFPFCRQPNLPQPSSHICFGFRGMRNKKQRSLAPSVIQTRRRERETEGGISWLFDSYFFPRLMWDRINFSRLLKSRWRKGFGVPIPTPNLLPLRHPGHPMSCTDSVSLGQNLAVGTAFNRGVCCYSNGILCHSSGQNLGSKPLIVMALPPSSTNIGSPVTMRSSSPLSRPISPTTPRRAAKKAEEAAVPSPLFPPLVASNALSTFQMSLGSVVQFLPFFVMHFQYLKGLIFNGIWTKCV